jgi:hypothetical protein
MPDRRQPEAMDNEREPPRRWRRRQRDLGYALWASFLMSCAATAVFFAAVDPEVLSGNNTLHWEIGREAGYAIGFFGFWLLTLATAAFVIWLVRSEPALSPRGTSRRGNGQRDGRRRGGLWRRRVRPSAPEGREERP